MTTKAKGYGAWQQDFADTYPTGPTPLEGDPPPPREFARLLRLIEGPACAGGPCDQGRRQCPTPHACRIHAELDAEDDDGLGAFRGLLSWPSLLSVGIVAAIVAVVVFA